MKTVFISAALALSLISTSALAQTSYVSGTATADAPTTFVKKRYNIKGTWNIAEENGQKVIHFNDDFKTKGGPDLKLYLSSNSISDLESGDVEGSSLKLSVLKSNKGRQSYTIPADVNLSSYKSVVIHCEAFSVLWGGFDLEENL